MEKNNRRRNHHGNEKGRNTDQGSPYGSGTDPGAAAETDYLEISIY
jgi:hypothetical protein